MRTSEEQLMIIGSRARHLRSRRSARRAVTVGSLAVAARLALIVVVSFSLPQMPREVALSPQSSYGSLLLRGPASGYVLIGVLAFLLGVCVTLLCLHLRNRSRG